MLTATILSGARAVRTVSRRNFGIAAPAMQKVSDPIQALFLNKVQEYRSKSTGGKLVDPTPEVEKELKQELDRVTRQLGGADGADMTKFPDFKFDEPKIDVIDNQN